MVNITSSYESSNLIYTHTGIEKLVIILSQVFVDYLFPGNLITEDMKKQINTNDSKPDFGP